MKYEPVLFNIFHATGSVKSVVNISWYGIYSTYEKDVDIVCQIQVRTFNFIMCIYSCFGIITQQYEENWFANYKFTPPKLKLDR